MAALVGLAIILALAFAGWLLYVAVRRGNAVRRHRAEWTVEQWANRGHTVIGVCRRPNPEHLTDRVVVDSIPDADPDWLSRRTKAYIEAQQRAVELNGSRS